MVVCASCTHAAVLRHRCPMARNAVGQGQGLSWVFLHQENLAGAEPGHSCYSFALVLRGLLYAQAVLWQCSEEPGAASPKPRWGAPAPTLSKERRGTQELQVMPSECPKQ